MADVENRVRNQRPYNNNNNRKRRFQERDDDDDDQKDRHDRGDRYDRLNRPQHRRRYNDAPPPGSRLRKQLLGIAESGMRNPEEEVQAIAKLVTDNFEDQFVRNLFCDLTLALVSEQPCKIVHVAAVVLYANQAKPELVDELLKTVGALGQQHLDSGNWRALKLVLRFLACLQPLFGSEGGVFNILGELFDRTIDLQTASPEDTVGLELVKIILLTIPYAMASAAIGLEEQATALLEKTDIVASTPHALENLTDPYPTEDSNNKPMACPSFLRIIQAQCQAESTNGWPLAIIPRLYKPDSTINGDEASGDNATKEYQIHDFPTLAVPSPVNPGTKSLFPEVYFSIFADQGIQSVPPSSDIAASLIRDSVADTVDLLDFNRNAAARLLIEIDCFFAPNIFVKRSTAFDKLKDIPEGRSTWKPEDMVVDAVFSQTMKLPAPEHKLVYYHSIITEACKIAPAAIAPSLGRAIRFCFRSLHVMDMEVQYRFLDWFSHHLSNFDFRWKWTEWLDEVDQPELDPRKVFILSALDKEMRLSFPRRVQQSIPEAWKEKNIVTEDQLKEDPGFKFENDKTPYAEQGRELFALLRSKTWSEEDVQGVLDTVQSLAFGQGVSDSLVASTDVFMTCICHVGSKSLSHVLSSIEKSKDRLLAVGPASEAARRQIISAVVEYWQHHPGVAVNIIDKLLNYTIISPMSVVQWTLYDHLDRGRSLARSSSYEMVQTTMQKVTGRVRQIVKARNDPTLLLAPSSPEMDQQKQMLNETLERERQSMRDLFTAILDAVVPVSEASEDGMIEAFDGDGSNPAGAGELSLLKMWGEKWVRVWRRKAAVEESVVGEMAVEANAEGIKIKVQREREAVEAEARAEADAKMETDRDEENGRLT